MYILQLLNKMFSEYLLGSIGLMCSLNSFFWLTLYVDDLSNVESGVLTSPTINILESTSPFRSSSICFICLYSKHICLELLFCLDELIHLSLCNDVLYLIFTVSNLCLFCLSIATPAIFWFLFAQDICQSIYFQSVCIFTNEMSFCQAAYFWEMFF